VRDLCRAFPRTLGVGLDLVAHSGPAHPAPNYHLVRGDVVAGLPFTDGAFDFVHQRLLRPGIPAAAWDRVVLDLARVTKPGGWLELAEVAGNGVESAGAATRELFGQLLRLMQTRGLDHDGAATLRLDDCLRRAGLTNIGIRRFDVPIGEWGGRAGSFMASDTRAAFMRLAPVMESRIRVPAAHTHQLIGRTLSECEEHHTTIAFSYGWAQRSR
jgi:SAM-dependent methyltransferase